MQIICNMALVTSLIMIENIFILHAGNHSWGDGGPWLIVYDKYVSRLKVKVITC